VPAVPKVSRLFEAHLVVRDVDRSVAFYRDVVGLPLALRLPDRGAAFLWVGRPGESMLGLWSLGSAPAGITSHVAFAAALEDVLGACDALRQVGVGPLSFFGDETAEPSVIGWMPAAAVYFRDPDGHQLEYLAMLEDAARPELGIVSWSDWTSADRGQVAIEPYTGPREALRVLFTEAEDSAAQLAAYIDEGRILVAVVGDTVVGHLQLVDDEIKNMAVAATHRGRGIGRTLITAAVDLARAESRPTLTVATATADIGNLRFYQRVGFRLRGVERDAFTTATGYAPDTVIDGIELRDRVWLDLDLSQAYAESASRR
jgi:GNAT superfamily N-acetyltransferase/predicted enzyme related to lactoylglutathione lyase